MESVPEAGVAQSRRNILIFSHTGRLGGAEQAALSLALRLVNIGHAVWFSVPSPAGGMADRLSELGVPCLIHEAHWTLPDFAGHLLHRGPIGGLVEAVRAEGVTFDLIVSNTAVSVDGALLAHALNVPHIHYIHESLVGEVDLSCSLPSVSAYNALLEEMSDGLIFCSEFTKRKFGARSDRPQLVAYPVRAKREYRQAPFAGTIGETRTFDLLVVGYQNRRKNMSFAFDVLEALRFRGWDPRVHIIGSPASDSERLHREVRERNLGDKVTFHGHMTAIFEQSWLSPVHLISALDEPFGLTMIESLAAGIPVVASNCGGPSEVMRSDRIFEIADLSTAVRIIETTLENYRTECERAILTADRFLTANEARADRQLEAFVETCAGRERRGSALPFAFRDAFQSAVRLDSLTDQDIVSALARASEMDEGAVAAALDRERAEPGAALFSDYREFDAVPFAPSAEACSAQTRGAGLALAEAAARSGAPSLETWSFICLALLGLPRPAGERLRACIVGDWLGLGAMRLASIGFDVDCVLPERAVATAAFRQILGSANDRAGVPAERIAILEDLDQAGAYDAVICLDGVTSAPDPIDLVRRLRDHVSPAGVLMLSETPAPGLRRPDRLAANRDLARVLPVIASGLGLRLLRSNAFPVGRPFMFARSGDLEGVTITGPVEHAEIVTRLIR